MLAWFLSDIHIKDINERNSQVLLRFLNSLKENYPETTHLYMLGDVFDIWVGDSVLFERMYQPIIDALIALYQAGVKIYYFEGNHDVHIREFWAKRGVSVFQSDVTVPLGHHLVRLEHGDFINPEEVGYHRYRRWTYSKWGKRAITAVPGVVWWQVASLASQISRSYSSQARLNRVEKLRSLIREYAIQVSKNSEFSLIITGHMHVRDEFEFEERGAKRISINLGSWFEEPMALKLTDSSYEWIKVKSESPI